MPEIWSHFPLEQMIIFSFISREALKTSSFSEKSIWLKKKHTHKKPTVFEMEDFSEYPTPPEEWPVVTATPP